MIIVATEGQKIRNGDELFEMATITLEALRTEHAKLCEQDECERCNAITAIAEFLMEWRRG